MKKFLILGAAAAGSAATALATLTLSAGVAWADGEIVGATYRDARAVISSKGMTAVVATTVGDRKDWDNCIVTSATPGPSLDGYGNDSGRQMMVNLNCYAKYSTSQWPGFSLQSPQGQKIYQADLAAKQEREAAQAAAQAQAEQDQLAAIDAQQAGE